MTELTPDNNTRQIGRALDAVLIFICIASLGYFITLRFFSGLFDIVISAFGLLGLRSDDKYNVERFTIFSLFRLVGTGVSLIAELVNISEETFAAFPSWRSNLYIATLVSGLVFHSASFSLSYKIYNHFRGIAGSPTLGDTETQPITGKIDTHSKLHTGFTAFTGMGYKLGG